MSVINDVKILCTRSKLFLTQAQLEKAEKDVKRRKKSRDIIKIGQGGTLDPLADGVLGALYTYFLMARSFDCACSRWNRQGYQET